MGWVKVLNEIERESNCKVYERITSMLIEREEVLDAIDNELNLIKYKSKEGTLEDIERLKEEVKKLDKDIMLVLEKSVADFVIEIANGIKYAGKFLNIGQRESNKFRIRGKMIGNRVEIKIGELIDETMEFTECIKDLVSEVEDILIKSKYEIVDINAVSEIIEKNDRYIKLHSRLSAENYLKRNEFFFKRHGGDHDIYENNSGNIITLPRHRKIKDSLSRAIQNEVKYYNKSSN